MAYKQKINPRTGKFDMVSNGGGGEGGGGIQSVKSSDGSIRVTTTNDVVDLAARLATESINGYESRFSKLVRDHSFVNIIPVDTSMSFPTPEAANDYLMTSDKEYYPVSGQTIRYMGTDNRMHDFRFNGNFLIDRDRNNSDWCAAAYDITSRSWLITNTTGWSKLKVARSSTGVFWTIETFPDTSTELWSMIASASFGTIAMSGNASAEYSVTTDGGETWSARAFSADMRCRNIKRANLLVDGKITEVMLFVDETSTFYLTSDLKEHKYEDQNKILNTLGHGGTVDDIATYDEEFFSDGISKENLLILYSYSGDRYLTWIRKNGETWTEVSTYKFDSNAAVSNIVLKDDKVYCSVGTIGNPTAEKDSCVLSLSNNTISLVETYTNTNMLIPTEYGLVRSEGYKRIYVDDTEITLPTSLATKRYLTTFAFDGTDTVMIITGRQQYTSNTGNYAFRLSVSKKKITNDAVWEELPIITEEDHGVITVENAKVRPAVFDEYIHYSKSKRQISANASDRNTPYLNFLMRGSDHDDVWCKVELESIVDGTTKVYSDEACTVEVGTITKHLYNISNPLDVAVTIGGKAYTFLFIEDKTPVSLATTKAILVDREATSTRMGYKVLRSELSFADQVKEANTIYEIRNEFDLNGGEVTIPEGCTLKFEGGSIRGGIIYFNYCLLEGTVNLRCVCRGDIQNSEIIPQWFGARGDYMSHPISEEYATLELAKRDYPFADSLTLEFDYCAIQTALDMATYNACGTIRFLNGEYQINKPLVCKSGAVEIIGNQRGITGSGKDKGDHGTTLQWTGPAGTKDAPNYILSLYTTRNDGGYDSDVRYKYRHRPVVKNIMLKGKSPTIATRNTDYTSGLYVGPSSFYNIVDCNFMQLYDGVVFSTTLLCDVDRCWFYELYRDCLSVRRNALEGSTTLRIQRSEFGVFGRYAIYIRGQVPTDNFSITQCDFEGTNSVRVLPKEDFFQEIKSAVCLVYCTNTLFKDNRMESISGHLYGLHIVSGNFSIIRDNIFDVQSGANKGAIIFSALGDFSEAYDNYYADNKIEDITSERNSNVKNVIANQGISVTHNYIANRTFMEPVHVAGNLAFYGASYRNEIIAPQCSSTPYKCFKVVDGKVSDEEEGMSGSAAPSWQTNKMYNPSMYVGVNMLSASDPEYSISNSIKLRPIPYYDSSLDSKYLGLYLNGRFNHASTQAESQPLFLSKQFSGSTLSKTYEAGVMTARKIRYNYSAIPTTGTWKKGDILFSTDLGIGKPTGWVCVADGTPGTWRAFGILQSQGAVKGTTDERPALQSYDNGYQYFDTTINRPIWWNGTEWIDTANSTPQIQFPQNGNIPVAGLNSGSVLRLHFASDLSPLFLSYLSTNFAPDLVKVGATIELDITTDVTLTGKTLLLCSLGTVGSYSYSTALSDMAPNKLYKVLITVKQISNYAVSDATVTVTTVE